MTPRLSACRMWLPHEGRAVGVDWSGAAQAHRKVWAATLSFEGGQGRLQCLQRPFTSKGANTVSEGLGPWLSAQDADVVGLDFCFSLEASQLASLGLPTMGPQELGRAISATFDSAESFRAAVGPEKKRVTEVDCSAPFAPTNLRMYKQTYWGLRALGSCRGAFPPWGTSPGPALVEVLPAEVVRWLGLPKTYKGRGFEERRREILRRIRESTDLRIPDSDLLTMVSDADGDALDALLAALSAASAWSSGFTGAPPTSASTGEGWIFSVRQRPEQ
ncbi:DUF429 domain-containing protein [Myxococcus sp. CA040A]|uniref:DUF429 domain-containing protein n=1 Tax=Myxococcus sp. CA040A TaxID=2741738 RepID=UPI00157A3C12|nr:DUF429 domain-containing protein [Myxococcus sp. CA040A]